MNKQMTTYNNISLHRIISSRYNSDQMLKLGLSYFEVY